MGRYIVRRLLAVIPVLAGVILVVFILSTVVPGDPARILSGQRGDPETIERIRREMGLDRPWYIQMAKFFRDAITFDLGRSYRNNMKVTQALADRIPASAKLAGAALLVAVPFGMVLGITSAVKQYSIWDYASMILALLGVSVPVFFFGLLMIVVFCVRLGWLPGTGYGGLRYLILPAITLGLRPAALIARITRSSMLEVVRQDYIRTARSKGVPEGSVVWRHALRNAMIPVITVIGVDVPSLLSGAMLTETIFCWPGIGRLAVEAVINRDFPIQRGVVLFMALVFLGATLIVDLSYGFFDPRVRYE
ncbi:MAG: ABC transporter permease [Bacillota bacterium]|nr:ABC transporter permease [Bacillota bacterium]